MKKLTLGLNIISLWTMYLIWLAMNFNIVEPNLNKIKIVMSISIVLMSINYIFMTLDEYIDTTKETKYGKITKYFLYAFWILVISGNLIFWEYYLLYMIANIVITVSRYRDYFIKKKE